MSRVVKSNSQQFRAKAGQGRVKFLSMALQMAKEIEVARQTTRIIEIGLPESLDDSLNALVAVSGVSKRSLIRDALEWSPA